MRKQTPTLTEAELRVMTALWDLGRGTVAEVLQGLSAGKALAYNTVLTTLRILERKGYVAHEKVGRAHVYSALVSQREARSEALRHMVGSFFQGSPELLMQNLLADENLSPDEIDRLRKMIGD